MTATATTTAFGETTLGEVARFIRGITFKPDDVVEPGTDGSVVCMRTKNVQSDLDEADLIAVPREFVKREEQTLRDGDILVSTANSWELVGKCSWVESLGYEATAGGFISILRANPRRVVPRYLYYWLSSPVIQSRLRYCGRKTTNISNLDFNQALALSIPLPFPEDPKRSLAEQKRIADILDKADDIRRKRQEWLNNLTALIDSQFLHTFGDLVLNPKKWAVLPLAEVAVNKDYQRVPLKESDRDQRHGDYPYYGAVGVIDHVDDYIYEGEHLLISEDGKHLESRNRPIACLAKGKFWVNNHAHVLAANGKADLCFLAWQIEHRPIREFVTGIDQFKLNRSSLDRIPVCVPPLDLQMEFRRQHSQIQALREKGEQASSSSSDLLKSLVQRAFRGEL